MLKRLPSRFIPLFSASYSTVPKIDLGGPYGNFFYKNLQLTRSKTPKEKPEESKLGFGKFFTDHMLVANWNIENGWEAPQIVPYQNLSLPPSASVLHYALECFEGMKAYSGLGDSTGKHFLFRPERNLERFNSSANRLAFPELKVEEVTKSLAKLIDVEKDWIPKKKGYSLYIRPTLIATEPFLGVGPAKNVLFFVILSPSGPYYPNGFKPVSLLADPQYVRAFKGGSGSSKLGANYAPTIMPQLLATKKGFDQICWLYGEKQEITEVGAMNLFFFWEENGQKELVTAPLGDGLVLPGITRDSIITLCKEWGINVKEKNFTIHDVVKKVKEGKMLEVFGAGTAAIVCPVRNIHYEGQDYKIPTPEAGLTIKCFEELLDMQHGIKKSEKGWVKEVGSFL
jgi:branched-chain amino acid aminotransferase